ncbi:hypothetical protein [Teredinibacter haidensis]|uniref:hypothetical protein n=1 Tax=Teredinibacter haidensis TaxID=2731755 RepID=UPI000948BAA7|nr:hypothetical protein [Teredinibacter haidensis]
MTVQLAQQILLKKFRQEPFHNLYLLNNLQPTITAYGGTCSDKTLSYLTTAKAAGLDAHLHSARIGGRNIHRLIRLEIDNHRYFADIGNGWPSIYLYSTTGRTEYECYGMRFRSEILNGVIKIYHRKCGVEKLQMEIDIAEKSENDIRQAIAMRFFNNITYPFSNQLRFSMVVGESFLFIRNTQLEIYRDNGMEVIPNISRESLSTVVAEYFGYDLDPIMTRVCNSTTQKQISPQN